jgi:hypothetical protein
MHGYRARDWRVLPTELSATIRAAFIEEAALSILTRQLGDIRRDPDAMKLILVILGILVASAAHAQNAPWCLQPSGDNSLHCVYATFQECLADRSGNGFCIQNSTYQPSAPSIRRR